MFYERKMLRRLKIEYLEVKGGGSRSKNMTHDGCCLKYTAVNQYSYACDQRRFKPF